MIFIITGTIGGLLSLFLGINIVNIFEIFYGIIQIFYDYITNVFNHK